MYHIVLTAETKPRLPFAYHFATDDVSRFEFWKQQIKVWFPADVSRAYNVAMSTATTDSADFASVQALDSSFVGLEEVKGWDEFVSRLKTSDAEGKWSYVAFNRNPKAIGVWLCLPLCD